MFDAPASETWLVACESSGVVRDAIIARGIPAMSCDLLETERPGPHHKGDVTPLLNLGWRGIIAHPDCTYLTRAAEWAYKDPDFDRYPGAGYHQRLKPGTLFGAERRVAREQSIAFVGQIWSAKCDRVVIENPIGVLSRILGRPVVVQPYMFGDDASKATCFWIRGCKDLRIPPPRDWVQPRMVCCGSVLADGVGKYGCPNCGGDRRPLPRWANQTDAGQNKLSPGPDRWRERARTYPGIARALAELAE